MRRRPCGTAVRKPLAPGPTSDQSKAFAEGAEAASWESQFAWSRRVVKAFWDWVKARSMGSGCGKCPLRWESACTLESRGGRDLSRAKASKLHTARHAGP